MKLRPSVLATLALPSFAAATPARRTEPTSQCTTGTLQCCNSVQAASSAAASLLLGLLGVVLQDLTIPIGITCSPITVIGAGDSSCNSQPACCTDNSFNGIVAIGCSPISV